MCKAIEFINGNRGGRERERGGTSLQGSTPFRSVGCVKRREKYLGKDSVSCEGVTGIGKACLNLFPSFNGVNQSVEARAYYYKREERGERREERKREGFVSFCMSCVLVSSTLWTDIFLINPPSSLFLCLSKDTSTKQPTNSNFIPSISITNFDDIYIQTEQKVVIFHRKISSFRLKLLSFVYPPPIRKQSSLKFQVLCLNPCIGIWVWEFIHLG